MNNATYEDARVVTDLAAIMMTDDFGDSWQWFWSDSLEKEYEAHMAKYPAGSDGRKHLARVLGMMETIATLWKHKILNEDLLLDWLYVAPTWDRAQALVRGMRTSAGSNKLYENLEMLAQAEKARDGS